MSLFEIKILDSYHVLDICEIYMCYTSIKDAFLKWIFYLVCVHVSSSMVGSDRVVLNLPNAMLWQTKVIKLFHGYLIIANLLLKSSWNLNPYENCDSQRDRQQPTAWEQLIWYILHSLSFSSVSYDLTQWR